MIVTDEVNSRSLTLNEVARVQPGYLSRSRVRDIPHGTYRLLQARDVAPDGCIQLDTAVRFQPERNPELYHISKGDILVVARGQSHTVHLITEVLSNTLASNVFYIVRPVQDRILPAYLAWWLNQYDVQAKIQASSRGTDIGYISRRALEELPVTVPPLAVQRRIEKTMDFWLKQKHLQAQLDRKRDELIQAVCRQAAETGNYKP